MSPTLDSGDNLRESSPLRTKLKTQIIERDKQLEEKNNEIMQLREEAQRFGI